MNAIAEQKIDRHHLERDAYVYIRQSTMRQVLEHTESTKRQYDLRQRALSLGWPQNQIVVIDDDLGESGAYTGREGFGRLVSEVGLGKAGIVCSLEVSRFARNSSDWHRLLEICALTDTLILDEEGVYNPAHFNDRLLLGLKGTMSEAELHVIRARLVGGMINKAKRGELWVRLPIGFIHKKKDEVCLDPDKEVQDAIGHFFALFRRVGSLLQAVRSYNKEKLLFPARVQAGPCKGDLFWQPLTTSKASQILHNPRYAGAFAYGRRQTERKISPDKSRVKFVARDKWIALVKDVHPGYITWDEYEDNLKIVAENRTCGSDLNRCAPREGPALLQGILYCGKCGKAMTVRYYTRKNDIIPYYLCRGQGESIGFIGCQSIPGTTVDAAISHLLIKTMNEHVLETALSVHEQIKADQRKTEELHKVHIERLLYECELARRRYMAVDPDNRLVASSLEADWNQRMRELQESREEFKRRQAENSILLDEAMQHKIKQLSSDFEQVWNNTHTEYRERKRMIRLLIEDVTIRKETNTLLMYIRFKGGKAQTLQIPKPLMHCEMTKVDDKVVEEIDRLLENHTNSEIAEILNRKSMVSGTGKTFNVERVRKVYRAYKLKSRYTRLRDRGLKTRKEIEERYGICRHTVAKWKKQGILTGHKADDQNQYLYEDPGPEFHYYGRRMLKQKQK